MLPRTRSSSRAAGACAAAAVAKAAKAAITITTRIRCLISILAAGSSGRAWRRTPFCPIRLPPEVHRPHERLRPVLGVVDRRGQAQILLVLEPRDDLEVFRQDRTPTVGHTVLIDVPGTQAGRHHAQLAH